MTRQIQIFGGLSSLAGIALFTAVAYGHREVSGDMYPEVKIEDKTFAVYFFNNAEREEPDNVPAEGYRPEDYKNHYVLRFAANGQLLQDRTSIPRREKAEEEWYEGPREGASLTLRQKGNATIFPLSWGSSSSVDLGGFFQKGSQLFLLLARAQGAGDDTPWPLFLGRYNLSEQRLEETTLIGSPARIYTPVASKIHVGDDDIALVGWIDEFTGDLILSRLCRGETRPRHECLAKRVGENASVSLNRIDDYVLIAWHTDGKVSTKHVALRNLAFKHRVRTSTHDPKNSPTESEAATDDSGPKK